MESPLERELVWTEKQLEHLRTENAALKEQVAYLEELNRKLCDKANQLTIMDARAGETIAQQAEAIEKLRDHIELSLEFCDEEGFCIRDNLENALAIQPSPEILQNAGRLMFELQSVTEQQAEAIRLKDEALIAVRDDLELRMRIAEDDSLNISNSVLDQMCDAIDIQPSPEILQARDDKVAEACAKVIDTHLNRSTYSTSLAEMLDQLRSGEWRKYL